jgi:hypothetical protein
MRQSATTQKNRQKHRNHGGRAALHSSDVELIWINATIHRASDPSMVLGEVTDEELT